MDVIYVAVNETSNISDYTLKRPLIYAGFFQNMPYAMVECRIKKERARRHVPIYFLRVFKLIR